MHLVLVGRVYGKAHDRELFSLLEQDGIAERVTFLGQVPPEDLPAIYSRAAALVYPSKQEGFGLVALEAMACGVPVITSGSGAIGEVVGDAALIVEEAEDFSAWSAAIAGLLADDTLRAQMRTRGLARAQRFSNAESARQILGIYQKLVGE
jgi:glycosyltransferase involved in cell wall biosynthesis